MPHHLPLQHPGELVNGVANFSMDAGTFAAEKLLGVLDMFSTRLAGVAAASNIPQTPVDTPGPVDAPAAGAAPSPVATPAPMDGPSPADGSSSALEGWIAVTLKDTRETVRAVEVEYARAVAEINRQAQAVPNKVPNKDVDDSRQHNSKTRTGADRTSQDSWFPFQEPQ